MARVYSFVLEIVAVGPAGKKRISVSDKIAKGAVFKII
jgi:hypothetical protein